MKNALILSLIFLLSILGTLLQAQSCGHEGCGSSYQFLQELISKSPKPESPSTKSAMSCKKVRAYWIVPSDRVSNEERKKYTDISLREWQQQWSSQGRTLYVENLQTINTSYTMAQIQAGPTTEEWYGFCINQILIPTVGGNDYNTRTVFFLDGSYPTCCAFGGGNDWGWSGNPGWAVQGFYDNYAFDANFSNGAAGIHGHEVGHCFDMPHEDGLNGSVNCNDQCIPKGVMCNGGSPSPCGQFNGYPAVRLSDWNLGYLNRNEYQPFFNELGGTCNGPTYIYGNSATVEVFPNELYVIRGKASNKVLTVGGDGNIIQQDYTGSPNQRWVVGPERFGINTPERIRYSQLINEGTGQAIDNYAYNLDAGGNVLGWANTQQINQYWRFVNRGGGYHAIQNLLSGRVIDVQGGSLAENANIQQWNWNGSDAQLWSFEQIDPCENLGGDSDSDGVCDSQDSCPNLNNNLIGTACNDNNPGTANDIWQSDCTCQGTPICTVGDICDGEYGPDTGIYDSNCNCITAACSDPDEFAGNCDLDGDGILNGDDEDDDNDGIVDTEECPISNVITNSSFDGAVGITSIPSGWVNIFDVSTNNLSNGAYGGNYPTNVLPQNSSDGGTWIGLGAYQSLPASVQQQITLVAGNTYTISFEQANFGVDLSSAGSDTSTGTSGQIEILIDAGTDTPTTIIGTGSNMLLGAGWTTQTMTYTAQNSGIHTLRILNRNTGNDFVIMSYLSVDNFQMSAAGGAADCDIDNDNILNQFDTDSDGDGCADAFEGGATIAGSSVDNNDQLTGDVNPNTGIPTIVGAGQSVGDSQDAAVQGDDCVTCNDSDNDGVCNEDDQCPGFDDALIGTACDDGDPCTTATTYDTDCNCSGGALVDADGDGICDEDDQCPGIDDAIIGTPCDDGDVCTTGDVYDANCNCTGTVQDADNDGICDANDACPNLNDNLIGTACDDGDDCTTGDTYGADCNCTGTLIDDDNDGICDLDQSGAAYDLVFSIGEVDCQNKRLNLDFAIKARNADATFNIADQNYRMSFDRGLANPTIVEELGLSGIYPLPNNEFALYSSHSMLGSADTVISYNIELQTETGLGIGTSPVPIGRIGFDILNDSNCFAIKWHNDDIYPPTSIIQEDNGSMTQITNGSYTDITICMDEICTDCIIDMHAFLEGAHDSNTNQMTTVLNERGLLPGQTPVSPLAIPTPAGQPYSVAPWNYAGTEGIGWTDADYTGNETDWVLVSMRSGIQKDTEMMMAAGLLMKDGSIVFPQPCALPTTEGSVYIVLEHRNHIGIMTPQPVQIINNTLTYDFRLADSYRDVTSFGQKQMPTGDWCLFAGDADQSDFPSFDITGTDKTIWFNNNGVFDYYLSPDFNLDGDVNGQDKTFWFDNNGISSRVPK